MTNRILLAASGLKISKSGYDVLTETDPGKLSFDTSFQGFGVRQIGGVTVAGAGLDGVVESSVFFTDLGYIPQAAVAMLRGGVYTSPFFMIVDSDATAAGFYFRISTNELIIGNYEFSSASFRYVISHKPVQS